MSSPSECEGRVPRAARRVLRAKSSATSGAGGMWRPGDIRLMHGWQEHRDGERWEEGGDGHTPRKAAAKRACGARWGVGRTETE